MSQKNTTRPTSVGLIRFAIAFEENIDRMEQFILCVQQTLDISLEECYFNTLLLHKSYTNIVYTYFLLFS
jgi:hypothetical protein